LFSLKGTDLQVPKITILCIGNVLMLDEGVGPRIAEELQARYEFPENVKVLDRGTMGMALLSDIRASDVILVVDAVDKTGLPPGTVVRYAPEDIAPYEAFHGAHDIRFIDVLQAAALLGHEPDAACIGVQILNMTPADYQIGLTEPVENSLPLLLFTVLKFLVEQNVPVIDSSTQKLWDGLTVMDNA
jgi:hydrogenase maturation protease